MWYSVTVPALEFDYLYITLTFFSVLSPSHFILVLLQSCVLSTVVLINKNMSIPSLHRPTRRDATRQSRRRCVGLADLPGRRRLRSSSSHQLLVPPFRLATVGRRTSPVAASLLCNSLPSDIQSSPSLPVLRLKTSRFRQSFPSV